MKNILDFKPVKKLLALSVMVLLLFGTILVAAPAGASTITAQVTHGTNWVTYNLNGTQKNWYTEYYLTGTGNDSGTTWDVFCIENSDANKNSANYTIIQPAGKDIITAAWIANQYYTTWKDDSSYNKSEVQSAIWEVVFESPDFSNINDGNFKITNTRNVVATNKINDIFGSIPTTTINPDDFGAIQIAKLEGHQDYVFYYTPPGDNNPVPEPATMLLFGVGLIGLAGVVRKTV